VIRSIALRAGVPAFSMHSLRHLCLTDLTRSGWQLHETAHFAGHQNLDTTRQYIHLSGHDLYFQRNLRLMEVLTDRQAINKDQIDEPWRYYDLSHGLCSHEFFDQCPHRMACARCDFYVPKESSRGDMITSKTGMIRMLQEIPLTDDERAAVEGDKDVLDRLLQRLKAAPPGQPASRRSEER
jgi:hypothetical protein